MKLLHTDEAHYLFAGDLSYNQGQLLHGELAGGNTSQTLARQSYERVLAHAHRHPLVYLPSHAAAARLLAGPRLSMRCLPEMPLHVVSG